jgi:hypothetical protein
MIRINNKYYLSPKVSNLLKKAGFDWELATCYIGKSVRPYKYHKFFNWNKPRKDFEKDGSDNLFHAFITQKKTNSFISAPTLEVAQRWLREVKNVWVEVLLVNATDPHYRVDLVNASKYNNPYGIIHDADYKEYEIPEEALEAGIKRALEIILKEREKELFILKCLMK